MATVTTTTSCHTQGLFGLFHLFPTLNYLFYPMRGLQCGSRSPLAPAKPEPLRPPRVAHLSKACHLLPGFELGATSGRLRDLPDLLGRRVGARARAPGHPTGESLPALRRAASWAFAQSPGKPPRNQVPKTSAKFPFSAPQGASLCQWFPWQQSPEPPPPLQMEQKHLPALLFFLFF